LCNAQCDRFYCQLRSDCHAVRINEVVYCFEIFLRFFLGFGDSALNFEVRFWAPRPEVAPELRSDVALSIAAALNKAGIKVPVPQRDLHIKTTDNEKRETEISRQKTIDEGTEVQRVASDRRS
jgi:small-conductance mechanosensitive channel